MPYLLTFGTGIAGYGIYQIETKEVVFQYYFKTLESLK